MRDKLTALTVAAAMLLSTAPAAASSVDQQLQNAKAVRDAKVAEVRELEKRFSVLQARYYRVEVEAGRAALALVTVSQAEQAAQEAVVVARQQLVERIRAAYEFGFGSTVQAILSAGSLAELSMIQEYAANALSAGDAALAASRVAVTQLATRRAAAAGARARLAPVQRKLATLLAEMRSTLAQAERAAQTGLNRWSQHRLVRPIVGVRSVLRRGSSSRGSCAAGR